MILSSLCADELIQMTELAEKPTELETALSNKLASVQKVLISLSTIADEL